MEANDIVVHALDVLDEILVDAKAIEELVKLVVLLVKLALVVRFVFVLGLEISWITFKRCPLSMCVKQTEQDAK